MLTFIYSKLTLPGTILQYKSVHRVIATKTTIANSYSYINNSTAQQLHDFTKYTTNKNNSLHNIQDN